jgi:hypothetical protein
LDDEANETTAQNVEIAVHDHEREPAEAAEPAEPSELAELAESAEPAEPAETVVGNAYP